MFGFMSAIPTNDCRMMRPGVPHFVVTTSDCLAIGGHFYCQSTFRATSHAVIWEHALGASITNAEHDTSPLILMKTLYQILSQCRSWMPSEDRSKSLKKRSTRIHISEEELSSLAVLLLYVDKLCPQRTAEEKKATPAWRNSAHFKHDYKSTRALVVEMYKQGTQAQKDVMNEVQTQFVRYMSSFSICLRSVRNRAFETLVAAQNITATT